MDGWMNGWMDIYKHTQDRGRQNEGWIDRIYYVEKKTTDNLDQCNVHVF